MSRIILLMVFLAGFGCSSKKVLDQNNSVSKTGVVKVWANWVKNKGKKFDIQFVVENLSDSGIIIYLNDIQCARGKRAGRIKHTFFNTGERTIDFRSGEIKQFNFVCVIGVKSKGPFNIRIVKVYENPEGDGYSKGKVLTKNLIWSTPEL